MIDVEENIELLQRSGRFSSEEEFLGEGFRALLEKRPELRIELAVEQYKTGAVTLNRAAESAGYSPEEFKAVLSDRNIRRESGFLEDEKRDEYLDGL